jgi:hypothetical protein
MTEAAVLLSHISLSSSVFSITCCLQPRHGPGSNSNKISSELSNEVSGKDSLFSQILVRLLNLLLGPSVHFLVKSSLAESSHPQIYNCPLHLIGGFITLHHHSGDVSSPWPGFSKILLGQLSQNSPLSLIFPHRNFPFTTLPSLYPTSWLSIPICPCQTWS